VELPSLINQVKSVKIQGASNIAKTILAEISKIISRKNYQEAGDLFFDFSSLKKKFLNLRPTEPLLENGFNYIEEVWPPATEVKILKKEITKLINKYLFLIKQNEIKIAKFGSQLIKNKERILTHCHSSLVENILIKTKKLNKKFTVYTTETRPLFQGRLTAKNLLKNQIPTLMVADSAASFLISRYSGKDLMMDKIIIGADALRHNGAVINKIGSFGIGLAAWHEKTPLYIATTLLKLDADNKIKIEQRSGKEIWPQAPKNLRIINYAFDQVPAEFITGIICEFGVIRPNQVKGLVEKNYPWLMKR